MVGRRHVIPPWALTVRWPAVATSSVRYGGEPVKLYLISLGVGVLVGVIYSLLNVRSPAPPIVALIGLAGMLVGEQIIPVGKQMLAGSAFHVAWRQSHCTAHIFGMLPGRPSDEAETAAAKSPEPLS
jgi:XapX domain-containing protein